MPSELKRFHAKIQCLPSLDMHKSRSKTGQEEQGQVPEYTCIAIPTRTDTSNSPPWLFYNQCSYKSYNRSNFKRHLRGHAEIRPFACMFCQKRFKLKKHLEEHVRIHTGEKPYECERCDSKFTSHGSWRHHMLKHHSSF